MKLISKLNSHLFAALAVLALAPTSAWTADATRGEGPVLTITHAPRAGGVPEGLLLRWQGDYIVEESASVTPPIRWRPVQEPFVETRDGGRELRYPLEPSRRFFRLHEPSRIITQEEAVTSLRVIEADSLEEYLRTQEIDPRLEVELSSLDHFVDLVEENELTLSKDIFKLPDFSTDWKKLFGINCYGDQCLDLGLFAQKVDEALEGKVTKYAYRIRGGLAAFEKAVGPRRTAADPPATSFSIHDRLNPASVTKTVTAVALLRALEQNGISIHASIAGYLPSYWIQHPSISTITFEEVLSHTSGFRTATVGGYEFSHLQQLILHGVLMADKVSQYENINYALARVLLCYVDGYAINWPMIDPMGTSLYFVDYLNKELFEPVGINSVSFTPEPWSNLFYPFPAGNSHGTAYGNWHLREGSAGIQLSVRELSEFLMRMWTPGTYLSAGMLAKLKQYGMGMGDYGDYPDGKAYGKGGYFPASMNGGAELNSAIIHFGSGVQAVLVINGPVSAKSTLLDAFQNAWKTSL